MSCLQSESEPCTGVLLRCVQNSYSSLFHLMSWYSSIWRSVRILHGSVAACAQVVFLLMHSLQLSVAGLPREFKQSLKSQKYALRVAEIYHGSEFSELCARLGLTVDILQIIP